MRFKLIIAFVEDSKMECVMQAARQAGATGTVIINHARGEGSALPKNLFWAKFRHSKRCVDVFGRGEFKLNHS